MADKRNGAGGNRGKKYVIPKDRKSDEEKKCDICDRPNGTVKCGQCGFETKGRVKLACPKHPRVVYFTDYLACPKCKVGMIEAVEKQDIYSPIKQGLTNATDEDENCICSRQKEVVYCSDCGWYYRGRKRKTCPTHPKKIFTSDHTICPNCKSTSLDED